MLQAWGQEVLVPLAYPHVDKLFAWMLSYNLKAMTAGGKYVLAHKYWF
jgi:hypothetical protein